MEADPSATIRPVVTVDIYSDVVCPWCYIGKRKFEAGLDQVGDDLGADVVVRYLPFQLDPTAEPDEAGPVVEAYASKFGGPERAAEIIRTVTERAADAGIEFHMERALRSNTLRAHRLLWWAGRPGSAIDQAALKERLLAAYFTEGANIGDRGVLADAAADVGADRAETLEFLDSDEGTPEVAAELERAYQEGITAVPTYVFNGTWAVPGAQEPDTFAQVLRKVASRSALGATEAPAGG